jgi:hypothetical protein
MISKKNKNKNKNNNKKQKQKPRVFNEVDHFRFSEGKNV